MSYGKRVNAIIWNDSRRRDPRTRFVANYIFDDGFDSLDECATAVPRPADYAYVCFCGQWYAVNLVSYHREIVVSREFCHYKRDWDPVRRCSVSEKIAISEFDFPDTMHTDPGRSAWKRGIRTDLERIDADILVCDVSGRPFADRVFINNSIIAFGICFFTNEISIKTDSYVYVVLNHYFGARSVEHFAFSVLPELRKSGVCYWNPYTDDCSYTDSERQAKRRKRESGVDMGEIIDNRQIVNGVKVMDAYDLR